MANPGRGADTALDEDVESARQLGVPAGPAMLASRVALAPGPGMFPRANEIGEFDGDEHNHTRDRSEAKTDE